MKIAIIADDLTGANDTGAQFARSGLNTSVLLESDEQSISELDVLVIDTDSRSLSKEEASCRVTKAAQFIKSLPFELVYKKMDSTMRGNIGTEIDAIYEVFNPDFVFIAPAYPENGRQVMDGHLFLNGIPIHETVFAQDPKTPITDSYIPNLLRRGTEREIGLIKQKDIEQGKKHIREKLLNYLNQDVSYIVFDSGVAEDLDQIVSWVKDFDFQVIWSGSAGLANHLKQYVIETQSTAIEHDIQKSIRPILTIIGSVNRQSRAQLKQLLAEKSVKGIEMLAYTAVADKTSIKNEIQRILREVEVAIEKNKDIVIYSSAELEEIRKANEIGAFHGLTPTMVSDKISEVLGDIARIIVDEFQISHLILTGGDTARKVCIALGTKEFRILDEIESGIPIGLLPYKRELVAITKAGGFGSADVLVHAAKFLRGEEIECVQSLD
ncbi:four-carbon acid sugar kinase family protein [Radiobacillus kanasensis]|uniref:four-carbon acid sugar kinase family protein n=1 Tax=Radiobacillus kanasensis TaxID=2844358 RepID=UPI001E2C3FC1|nr:four-carbon acid sugar kinase family protein [Radiobacillus kanasensis]UFT98787.1 four-carbon acid sugar kinase family protein [Radiobacillus kanasensis]